MEINGFKLKYSIAELKEKVNEQMRKIELIDENNPAYTALSDGDKKALKYLADAAKIMNNVALEMDNPHNLAQKKALEEAAPTNEQATLTLKLFNSLNGVAGFNGIDKEPVELFEDIKMQKGCNFYPAGLTAEELAQIISAMLDAGHENEVRKILSARTMVRRNGDFLKAIDFTEYFAKEFSEIANLLECAAHFADDDLFKDFLGWQAQALLQNNEEMDILADKHWARMQDSPLEFTISRENYEDKLTPTIFDNAELTNRLAKLNIAPVPKDMLGVRVGIVNKEGTTLLLKFKDEMTKLAGLMPKADSYTQNIGGNSGLKQTMVDVDLTMLSGDYAMCRGGITLAQNLPNNDKPSLKHGGGRRNVYHRQVRQSGDKEKTAQILNGLVDSELHQYYDEEADHLFTIGHENGHSLGPDSSYQTALGVYQHIIEEHKANLISASMMPEYVKAGIISAEQLKKIYATWVIKRHLMTAYPSSGEAHRVADLIEYNYLTAHNAIYFDKNKKLHIDFAKMPQVCRAMLEDIISIQLSKSPEYAKAYIEKWTDWSEISQYVADFKLKLGVKPYIELVTHF
ncbi:MAG: hypothetical protein MR350_02875 [Alphaproteobacteria bacterium]|nr:hypothetical protein [Alphaproteobacteria bacterium]